MAYFILATLILLYYILLKKNNIKIQSENYFLLPVFIILFLFLSFRSKNIGLDMDNYHYYFDLCGTLSITDYFKCGGFEFGYRIYNFIMYYLLNGNFNLMIVITSFLSLIGVYYFIKENSNDYFMSIMLFIMFNYFIYYTCTLRQVLAISALLIGVQYIKKRKIFPFILFVFLATMFHKTSIAFLILYPLYNYELKEKYVICYLIGNLFLFILKKPIVIIFTTLVYRQYINYGDTSGSGYMMLAFLFLIALLLFVLFKNNKELYKKNRLFYYMILISLPFQILATYQGLLARIVLYFTYSLIILIPNVLHSIKDAKIKKYLVIIFYILLSIFFIREILTNSMYVPYQMFI